jgi:site-specific recombinase XerD
MYDVCMMQAVAIDSRQSHNQQPSEQPLRLVMGKKKTAKPIRGVYEYPAGSGTWWINYYADGQRHREKVGTKSSAIDLYRKRKNDVRAGVKLPDTLRAKKVVLFDDLIADAMIYSKAHKRSHKGDVANLSSLEPVFGKVKASDITPQAISAYFATRTDLKPASINRYRSTMSMIFQEGIRNGRCKENPARLVRLLKEKNARIRFLTYVEEDLIRSVIKRRCPEHEPDFTVALETGMRRGEQHTTEWPDVSLDRRQIQLIETKNGSSRVVILNDEAVAALNVCRQQRAKLEAKKGKPIETRRVFLSRYGEPMNDSRGWFRFVMEDAVKINPNLADVTWHTFRHTFISRLVMAGVDMRTVQELAGHKSITMTARYAHLSPDHQQDAVERLSAYRKQQINVVKKK